MCAINPGYPEAAVIWYKENHHIDGEDMRITVKENGLEIQNVQQTDEGMYECYVHNEVGYDSLDIHVAFRGKRIGHLASLPDFPILHDEL